MRKKIQKVGVGLRGLCCGNGPSSKALRPFLFCVEETCAPCRSRLPSPLQKMDRANCDVCGQLFLKFSSADDDE